MLCSLNNIKIGQAAVIEKILIHSALRRRFMELGITLGADIECLGESPQGDPRAYLIRGAVIAIRNENAKEIFVSPITKEQTLWD